jgi:3',5'-cyclic-AMP phosphodiesterase
MKLLWMTDLHLRGADEAGYAQASTRFSVSLAHALIITGDIANDAKSTQYAHYAALSANSLLTKRELPGNHDDPAALAALQPGQPALPYSEVVGKYRLFYLDSQLDGQDAGKLGPDQLIWLDQALSTSPEPAILFLHHQPTRLFMPSIDSLGLEDAAQFQELLARHRQNIAHIGFGHAHLAISGSVRGIPFTGLPAISLQMQPNFASAEFIPTPDRPPFYGVIIANETSLVVHTVEVKLLAENE